MTEVERVALSRRSIALAALDLIDADGLDGLSMRKLGSRLGVEAMSLYHYVSNKGDLLDAAVEQIYLEIEIPDLDGPEGWESAVRQAVHSFHRALIRHANAVSLFATRPAVAPGAFEVFYTAHRRLQDAGLSPSEAHNALNLLVGFVLGHMGLGLDGGETVFNSFALTEATPPEVVSFIESGRALDQDTKFNAGLDVIILGLRTRFRLP